MKYSKRKYTLYFIGLLLLVLVSVCAPQILFQIQDSYSMDRTRQETRNSLDFENLNYTYEESLRKRMYRFARGIEEGRQYNIASTEYQVTQEIQDIWKEVCEDRLITILKTMREMPDSTMNEAQTVECKKYVIYEGEFENGAAFIMWYIKSELADGTTMKILMDVSGDTIYYVQLMNSKGIDLSDDTKKYNDRWFEYNYIWDYIWDYFCEYYEADINENDKAYNIRQGWLFTEGQLLYQQYKLNFWISQEEDGTLSAGICQLEELIPEMLQE